MRKINWTARIFRIFALCGIALAFSILFYPSFQITAQSGISTTAWYEIVNTGNGLCVDDAAGGTANGTIVQQYTCGNPNLNQQWQFVSNGGSNYHLVSKNGSNMAWDATNLGTANGTLIQLWSYGGGNNQIWTVTALDSTHYEFINVNAGRCLDNGGTATNGVQFKLWDCQSGNNNQSYSLVQVSGGATPTFVPPTITPTSGEAPYGGTAWAIPGTVQVENYDTGGQNVGYSKPAAGTSGLSPAYRTDEVAQIEATGDTGGGFDVGWTNTNDWYKYTVNVIAAGSYSVNVRVASPNTTAAYHVEVDGTNVTGSVVVPNTGGWQTYSTLTKTGVNLSAGHHVLRLVVDNGGMNLNWISVTAGATATNTPVPAHRGVIGNTIVGYQGWFSTVGDGSTYNSWFHWSNGGVPGPGNLKFELYPDVREYTTLFQTNFANLGNGSPAKLFSSYSTDTVNLHFKWMKDNNIDGAALQRFGSDIQSPGLLAFRNSITTKVRTAAEANGRIFYIMYDVSGMGTNFVSQIESDWTNTMVPMNLTASPSYAFQNGKPVVCIWGVGFSDRPGTASDWITLINWFKSQGVYVIGGTPPDWRLGESDVKTGFGSVWTTLNMLQPWVVGRYSTDSDVDNYKNNTLVPDIAYLSANGVDFQPIAFAGFAWSNWVSGAARNQIPRRQGNLFWRQVYNIKSADLSTLYIAMFDEYDEGTAIAKAAEDTSMIPTNQYFLTLDADGVHLTSDFYLRLAGAANQMLKGQIPLSLTIPISH